MNRKKLLIGGLLIGMLSCDNNTQIEATANTPKEKFRENIQIEDLELLIEDNYKDLCENPNLYPRIRMCESDKSNYLLESSVLEVGYGKRGYSSGWTPEDNKRVLIDVYRGIGYVGTMGIDLGEYLHLTTKYGEDYLQLCAIEDDCYEVATEHKFDYTEMIKIQGEFKRDIYGYHVEFVGVSDGVIGFLITRNDFEKKMSIEPDKNYHILTIKEEEREVRIGFRNLEVNGDIVVFELVYKEEKKH